MNQVKCLLTIVGIGLAITVGPFPTAADDPACELGRVNWQRDLDAAKKKSGKTGQPILVLFQEVPGCQTCQDFGKQPLSHPLMVEAIEDLFIPVLIYNNKKEDEQLLHSFGEPSWNNPVIRYVDGRGKDLIARKDRIWTTTPTAARMVSALEHADRDVPQYLRLLAGQGSDQSARATFAMHCYWEGEAKLGKLDGVQSTISKWVGKNEVVELTFDPDTIDYATLLDHARSMECASTVFAHDDQQFEIARRKAGQDVVSTDENFAPRLAKESDQKYYLRNSIYRHLPLAELQAVKINGALYEKPDHAKARSYLSPRQLELLAAVERRLQADKNALRDFVYPANANDLADYDERLRKHLER